MRYFERFRNELTTVTFAISNAMPHDVLEKWIDQVSGFGEDDIRVQGFKVYCEAGKATERIPQFVEVFRSIRPNHPVEFVPNVESGEMGLMLELLSVIGHVEGMHDKAEYN